MTKPRLTAIGSGKGGTGKTFVATVLAAELAQPGNRVLLCDADFGLSNAGVLLGLESGGDFAGVVFRDRPLASAVIAVAGGAGARGGFDLLAAPPGSGAFADLDADKGERLIASIRASSAYDRVLLDLSAGIEARTMAIAARADETILVLSPDPSSLTDAYAFVKLLVRRGAALPWIAANLVAGDAEGLRTHESLARTCRAFLKTEPNFLGSIPRDPHVASAIRQQRLLTQIHPQAPAARAIGAIARRLEGAELEKAPRAASRATP
jgi:flagellar biosynthesis protein FlhG